MSIQINAGDTVLLTEGKCSRWVRITHTSEPMENGEQNICVLDVEQFGRAKPRRVTLGKNARVEWVS